MSLILGSVTMTAVPRPSDSPTAGPNNAYFKQLGLFGLDHALAQGQGKRQEMVNAMLAGLDPTSLAEATQMRDCMTQAVAGMGLADDQPSGGTAAAWDVPAHMKENMSIDPEVLRRRYDGASGHSGNNNATATGDAAAAAVPAEDDWAFDVKCAQCGKSGKALQNTGGAGGDFKRCSRCKAAFYCGPACQKKDWPTHKAACAPPAKAE